MSKKDAAILKQIDSMEQYADEIKRLATGLRKKLGQVSAPAPSGGITNKEVKRVFGHRKKLLLRKSA